MSAASIRSARLRRSYYDPPPDAVLGGVRITDAPREAQVFVDGAYVGIVDDFDGAGQHLNLEPGLHRIEIHTPASGAIAFDVIIQQGRPTPCASAMYRALEQAHGQQGSLQ